MDELVARIAWSEGIYETNRGGDKPAPKESKLDTVAGVHASFAEIQQATMPFAIDALIKNPFLAAKATPVLTRSELESALACSRAVSDLLKAVYSSALAGSAPETFVSTNAGTIEASFLSRADVRKLFEAVKLKRTIDILHNKFVKGQISLKQAVTSLKEKDRLGLGSGSLKSYIRKPANWGENRAAWQRKAVSNMPNQIGERIESVVVADGGTALAGPIIRKRVMAALRRKDCTDEQHLVEVVAQQNNPAEAGYGKRVFAIYSRHFMGSASQR